MKTVILTSLFISLISCQSQHKKNDLQHSDKEVKKQVDTIQINNQEFIKISTVSPSERFMCLTTLEGDTIVPFEDFYRSLQLVDINLDGYQDLRVYLFSNTPNNCDSYLFDPNHQIFRVLENSYFDITPIVGTQYFYSYARGGCADFNWESNLSKIENYKLIHIGYIDGQGCGSDEETSSETPQIEIYKVFPETEKDTLIEILPYKTHIPTFGDKWKFIKAYWSKNYTEFEN